MTQSMRVPFTMASGETVQCQTEEANRVDFFERYAQPCLAELIGSTLFIFLGCISVISNVGMAGNIQPALAHGLALAITVAVFGKISGGHFNPAVTLCVYLVGGLEVIFLAPYVLAQLLGGLIGAGIARAISPPVEFNNASGAAFTAVSVNSDAGPATGAEIVLTFILTLVVCMEAVNEMTRSKFAPFVIGLTVTTNILAGGMISGACMNPARAFGPAVVANHWAYHWVYWVGPISGALLSVSIIRLLIGDKNTRIVFK